MENLSKKQKILIYALAIIMCVLVVIYVFTKDNMVYSDYNNLYIEDANKNVTVENIENLICIHIIGEVHNPCVVKLEEGARITDAIEKAGGLTDSAEVGTLNLAYKLKDGEQIYIPSLDDILKYESENKKIVYISSEIESQKESSSNAIYAEGTLETEDSLININTATQTELETLNGIGPSTAKNIIDYRKENGKFENVEDIMEVTGIGESKFNGIKDEICVN